MLFVVLDKQISALSASSAVKNSVRGSLRLNPSKPEDSRFQVLLIFRLFDLWRFLKRTFSPLSLERS
jgi:hypothetical protein